MIDLSHIRSFVVVAHELHFGRAARQLNMTQPPLSRQIQLLEQELDVELFVRANRTVRLTPAGQAFLVEAVELLQKVQSAVQVARGAVREHTGTAAIGFIGACSYGFLPRLVAAARRELPEVTLAFQEMGTEQQLDALARGELDLGLIRPSPARKGLSSVCVQREGLALALPAGHRLARLRRPSLDQLEGEPFIMYSTAGRHMHDILSDAFGQAGIQPRIVQQMSHAQAILSLVSTGLGVAIVPEETRNACFDNVVLRPIHLGTRRTVDVHLVWRHREENSVVAPLRQLILRQEGSEQAGAAGRSGRVRRSG